MNGVTAMDENGEDIKSPIKRLGSTRKLLIFNSKCPKILFIYPKISHTRRTVQLKSYLSNIFTITLN